MQSTTSDQFRQLMEEWDALHEPRSPFYPDSIEWDEYLVAREQQARSLEAGDDAEGTDIDWLESQALYYRSVGSDVARLAADALSGLARDMAGAGHFDAGGYYAHLRDLDEDRRRAELLDEVRAGALGTTTPAVA